MEGKMELTPAEKNRIYEEEKARLEALKKIKEEDKFQKKQQIEIAKKKDLHIAMEIIAVIAVSWFLYTPIKTAFSSLFLSKEVLDKVAEIELMNENIDRDKAALWDVGLKKESLNNSYLSYPESYDTIRTLSLIISVLFPGVAWWLFSYKLRKSGGNKGERFY